MTPSVLTFLNILELQTVHFLEIILLILVHPAISLRRISRDNADLLQRREEGEVARLLEEGRNFPVLVREREVELQRFDGIEVMDRVLRKHESALQEGLAVKSVNLLEADGRLEEMKYEIVVLGKKVLHEAGSVGDELQTFNDCCERGRDVDGTAELQEMGIVESDVLILASSHELLERSRQRVHEIRGVLLDVTEYDVQQLRRE